LRRRRVLLRSSLRAIAILIFFVFFVFPVYWTINVSFMPESEYFASPPSWVPREPTLKHYRNVFSKDTDIKEELTAAGMVSKGSLGEMGEIFKYIVNSVVISFMSTLFSFTLGVPCAYGLARLRLRKKDSISFYILSTRMLPPVALIIPIFLLYKKFALLDTRIGLALIYTVFNLSFAIWLMKGFFEDIPEAIEESALVDGCSRLGALIKVMMPIAAPGIAAAMILCMIFSWNEFLFALILSRGNAVTLPVALAGFKELRGIMWGDMCAASMCTIVPLGIFSFVAQKYIIAGLSFGGVKE
jgi:multiple sugar transport system permease protein